MAGTINFKCPGCGGYLEFDPDGGVFRCAYCGKTFDEREIREKSAEEEKEAEHEQTAGPVLTGYHCANCGAEIVTDETTAATRCYYCHNPVVITERVSDGYRPDKIIPFRIDRENARKTFDAYIAKQRFVDRAFFSGAQLEDFSGVYYPYWIGNVEGEASFSGEGKTVDSVTVRDTIITTTRYYRLEREGRVFFSNMIRKALKKADRQLSDGIHPYDRKEMQPFASGFLSGFLAEKRDVEKAEAEEDIVSETRGYVRGMMTRNSGLSGLSGETRYEPDRIETEYALLPAWVLTYMHPGRNKVYYYMMNGQNGRVCGKLPLNRKKLFLWCAGLGAAVFGLLCAGGAFLW